MSPNLDRSASRGVAIPVSRLLIAISALAFIGCELPFDADETREARPALSGDAAGAPVFAVDVSHWSGTVAESEVACWWDSGVRHVITGTQNSDINTQQLQMAVDAGMTVDAYVMLYWDYDITDQVERALAMTAPFPIQRLWLDAEQPPGGRSAAQLIQKIQEAVNACGTQACGIYTRKVWWRDYVGNTAAFSHMPIWYAYYNGRDDFNDWYNPLYWYEGPFGGWDDPTGKQYDSDWTAPDLCNVNLDYNIMYRFEAVPSLMAEVGKVTTSQASESTWQSVSLSNSYVKPVVVMQPPSYNGGQPSTIRIRNVSASGFEFQIDEWDYLDGAHTTETMSYLVVEAGVHRLANGGLLQAGTLTADHNFRSVSFAQAFASTPVIVSQVQSYNGGSAVVTRQRAKSAYGFDVRVQEEEANDGIHVVETVGYLAVQPGSDVLVDVPFEASLTPDAVTHVWYPLTFGDSYSDPAFLAGVQTTDGGDPVGLRYRSLGPTGAEIFLEEEKSADGEVGHTTEVVGYLVFENPAGPVGGPPPAPTGLDPSDDATITTSSVTLTVDPIADATLYDFEIEYLNGSTWTYYHTYSSTEPSQTFWPVHDDTPYRWRARAQNEHGWGPWSGWATFNFGDVGSTSPPPAPTGLNPRDDATITTSSVTLTVDPIAGATGYDFEIEYISGGTWTRYYTYSGTEPSRTFWPVYDDTPYRWRARAQNEYGWGPWSGWATFNFGDVGSTSPPPAPTGLSPSNGQTITTSSVTLTVDPISDATAYEFRIEYLSGGAWTYYYTYSGSAPSRTFWPAVHNTSYRFQVRAKNEHGWGPWSGWATFSFQG